MIKQTALDGAYQRALRNVVYTPEEVVSNGQLFAVGTFSVILAFHVGET